MNNCVDRLEFPSLSLFDKILSGSTITFEDQSRLITNSYTKITNEKSSFFQRKAKQDPSYINFGR